jgi:type VI secretion system FHA domain protein
MILTLEVTGRQAQQLGSASRKVFRAVGGTIGRLADNDWVIPDPYISGRHALIRYLNGKFFVEDTSTNGVYINSQDNRLRRSEPHPLKNGDRLYIDAYEIKVSIASDKPAEGRGPNDALARRLMGQAAAPAPEEQEHTASLHRQEGESDGDTNFEEIDPLAPEVSEEDGRTQYFSFDQEAADLPTHLDPPSPTEVMKHRPAAASAEPQRPLAQPPRAPREVPYTPPTPPAPKEVATPPKLTPPLAARDPVVRDPAPSGRFAKPATPPPAAVAPAKPAAASIDAEASFRALLAAAGVRDLEPSVALGAELGEILRTVIDGTMDAMRTRDRFKEEFRLRSTTFKPANNNPLKLSVNVEDALHNLLVKTNAAYLSPQEAFEDAFRDVRHHEMAIIASMRTAFEATLGDFDPGQLQEEFDRQLKKGSLLGVPPKLRYWDLFREFYGELKRNKEQTFLRLFGEEFSRAYEERLEHFRTQNPPGKK